MWPFQPQDTSATDPAALSKASKAGYSTYEWGAFTPELRASFLSDPTFGTAPIVDPVQKQPDPSRVFKATFMSGVKEDVWKLAGKLKGLVGIGGVGLAIGGAVVLWWYFGRKGSG